MMRLSAVAGCLAAALLLASCASTPAQYSNGVMTNTAGMTLYTFDKDAVGSGKSACSGQCAQNWPPFLAASDSKSGGDWSVVARDDGSRQWAYQGKPLYLWAKDKQPGDKTGDGFNKVWHVVPQPAATHSSSYY